MLSLAASSGKNPQGILIANQKAYPITHDLFLLLEQILSLNPDAERLRDTLAILVPYAVEVRYPDDYYMPAYQDAIEAREAVAEVYEWLKSACPAIFS